MALVSATAQEYADFQALYGYTASASDSADLALSFAFMGALPFCDGDVTQTSDITSAQMFIANAMSGGGFNPAAVADARVLVEESIGRGALIEKWDVVNTDSLSSDPYTMLKSIPIAFALLSSLLCPTTDCSIGIYVV